MIKNLICEGFRGFSKKQQLDLAIPNGKRGSGLTVLIGPNGGGKSTLVECFTKFKTSSLSFTVGKRNKLSGDKVYLSITDTTNNTCEIQTVDKGGSEVVKKGNCDNIGIYYLPARRVFNPYFGKTQWTREQFIQHPEQNQFRANVSTNITYRLFTALENAEQFNALFWRVLGQKLDWTIDQDDNNQYYIKINKNSTYHNSDGLGEGIVSLLFLCDALYDSKPNETIIIDEPELSLHPQLQSRLLNEILEYTKNEQIVISTHSPMMLSIEAAINGGVIGRVFESENSSIVMQIDDTCRDYFKSFSADMNNPHVVGYDARASLFTDDGLILTEGQEDVVLLPTVIEQLSLDYKIPFYGFGSGGAGKIEKLAYILSKLGFSRIGAIFDGDKKEDYEKFIKKYSDFHYQAWILPKDDIRDKKAYSTSEKSGVLDTDRIIKSECKDNMRTLLNQIQKYIIEN